MNKQTVKLTDICDFQGGSQPPKEQWLTTPESGYIRMLQIRDFTQSGVQEEYIKLTPSTKTCKKDDILIARYGASVGKILTGLEGAYNVAIMKTIPNERVLQKKYLYYFLRTRYFQDTIQNVGSRAAQAGFNKSELEDIMIYLPNACAQEKIVCVLEKAQQLIDKRKEQIQACEELIKSQFIEMFGSVEQTKYAISSLNDICEFIKDGTHQTPTYTEDKIDGYKFISSKDVTSGKIDWSNIKYIPKELHEELYAKIAPRRNDILLAKNGTTGICAIVETDDVFDIYVSVAILRPKQGYNSQYLWGAINSFDTKRHFDRSLKGIGVPNLHLGEIKKTKIIVPPIELQNEFAQFVQQVDKLKFGMEQSLKELEDNFDSLMQRAFKGELF